MHNVDCITHLAMITSTELHENAVVLICHVSAVLSSQCNDNDKWALKTAVITLKFT